MHKGVHQNGWALTDLGHPQPGPRPLAILVAPVNLPLPLGERPLCTLPKPINKPTSTDCPFGSFESQERALAILRTKSLPQEKKKKAVARKWTSAQLLQKQQGHWLCSESTDHQRKATGLGEPEEHTVCGPFTF